MSEVMNVNFIEALEGLEEEKGISKEALLDAIESALTSAYKKSYGVNQNIRVEVNRENGGINVFTRMAVVSEIEDLNTEMTLDEAQDIDPRYEIGDIVEYQIEPEDFSRIAAQTAKQVVMQRIREMERGMIYDDFIEKQGKIVGGRVQRISSDTIFITMGRAEGILPQKEQVRSEKLEVGDRIKVFVMDVKKTTKGPQVFLSRTHPGLVKGLFELEVPEIEDGVVEIKSIAREAGSRTKIAVEAMEENVDAVGACVGSRGNRVQRITDELFEEKVDIINWSDNPAELITNVLSPAAVEEVIINSEAENLATVIVPDFQLSLAIGKAGQNVRLAARLCGWKIDIKSHTDYYDTETDTELDEETEAGADTKAEAIETEAVTDTELAEETETEADTELAEDTEADTKAEDTEAEADTELAEETETEAGLAEDTDTEA